MIRCPSWKSKETMSQNYLIRLQTRPIDCNELLLHVASPECGATVLFTGSPRQFTVVDLQGTREETAWLEYECYAPMAEREMNLLCTEATRRFDCRRVAIVHRTGPVAPGETSIAITVGSPHRAAAFAAAQWIMEGVKSRVPVWKRDHAPDGTSRWVGLEKKTLTSPMRAGGPGAPVSFAGSSQNAQ